MVCGPGIEKLVENVAFPVSVDVPPDQAYDVTGLPPGTAIAGSHLTSAPASTIVG
jgi:hypothetical protein